MLLEGKQQSCYKTVMGRKAHTTVRAVNDQDRQPLANLIHFEAHVHRHLDWRPPLDWLGSSPYLVAERDRQLAAALACPPDPPEISWIRMFAVASVWDVDEAWNVLWQAAQVELHERRIITVAAIPLQKWFRVLLEKSYFQLIHNVVLLLWQSGYKFPVQDDLPVNIRPMNFDDLDVVHELDALAFGPVWRNSLESLTLAFKQSAVSTVAEDDSGILGYQISTANPMGGHLARLAVHPEAQGQGIGYGLVRDVLDQFERRGATRVTVNTQQENKISLALYEKAGFRKTNEIYPVYQFRPTKRTG